MHIIPWRNKTKDAPLPPTETLSPFGADFDRMVESFFGDAWNAWPIGPLAAAGPGESAPLPLALDVSETDEEVLVRAELPGVEAKHIDVTVDDDVLTISAEKSSRAEEREESVFHSERRFGAFRRSVRLPSRVDADRVSAGFEAGILTVRLPRSAEARPRHITVKTGR